MFEIPRFTHSSEIKFSKLRDFVIGIIINFSWGLRNAEERKVVGNSQVSLQTETQVSGLGRGKSSPKRTCPSIEEQF